MLSDWSQGLVESLAQFELSGNISFVGLLLGYATKCFALKPCVKNIVRYPRQPSLLKLPNLMIAQTYH